MQYNNEDQAKLQQMNQHVAQNRPIITRITNQYMWQQWKRSRYSQKILSRHIFDILIVAQNVKNWLPYITKNKSLQTILLKNWITVLNYKYSCFSKNNVLGPIRNTVFLLFGILLFLYSQVLIFKYLLFTKMSVCWHIFEK